jgi:CysZ protein
MINDIITSVKTYFEALKIINKLNLWRYFLIPAVLGLLLGLAIISVSYTFSANLGTYISDFWPFEFGKGFVTVLSRWISGFIILILGITFYKNILMAVSAPLMSPMSEKVEAYLTGKPIEDVKTTGNYQTQLVRSIRLNGRNLFRELLITLPLMLLSFIPVFGLITVVLIFYFQSYFTGFGNMDYTLERHLNYKDSKLFVKKYKGIAFGNGAVFTLMLFIPLVGIMVTLPISTVASTVDTVKKLHLME